MGVEWGDDLIVLKPFLETATYRNVLATGAAVVNLTDDVRVYARAAISNPTYATVPANVAVVAGATTATFPVATSATKRTVTVAIQATSAGVTKAVSLTVKRR